MEAHSEIVNGTQNKYPSNGINFASAGSGVLQATNNDSVTRLINVVLFNNCLNYLQF